MLFQKFLQDQFLFCLCAAMLHTIPPVVFTVHIIP